MGNAESDRREDTAYAVMRWVPFVNIGYGAVRSIVYASKGDSDRAITSVCNATEDTAKTMILGAFKAEIRKR